ncbi:hypothetical protein [Flavobacterium sp. '19STA2R22 D10 B1']|uniref:hypothetical protein n=1 Tax=Flavobacterium aerium TaxID=3037261 RepID=UPI00278BCD74|nr:hypothetical protein [Flavobacterium sp. '19STA2R22 D10 B1']
MKKQFLNILMVSSIITTIAFLMDGDIKEPSMLMRFVEFFGMVGIVFLLTSVVYFISSFVLKKTQKMLKY